MKVNEIFNKYIEYSKTNQFDRIRELTYNLEKNAINGINKSTLFDKLIDDLTVYSDYSLINTLLIRIQYPNFLSLNTEKYYNKLGFKLIDNAIGVDILKSIIDTSGKFKELQKIKVYDEKETSMYMNQYTTPGLPPLINYSYDDIYNSFVKALYKEGYKIKYQKLDEKINYDKDTKVINLHKGLNKQISIKLLLDFYTTNNTINNMEKDILQNVIERRIGIDTREIDLDKFKKWCNSDNERMDHLFKIIINRGRGFTNNFIKFFENSKENIEVEDIDLYDEKEINFSI